MGEVWEARHLALGASVAIKFAAPRSAGDAAFAERFRREACAMAQLRSPNIVQIFDVGVGSGQPYLVMELLAGESLRCRLEREKTLPLPVCVQLAKQVARALAVIHRFGMVHRDVTPANLFLVEPSADYPELHVKLLDFGIAKQVLAETRITTSGTLIGSPAYMSPEQARAEALDARSDLWALGAVLYRCLSGRDAFEGSSLTDVLFRICTGEVPRCTVDNPLLPAELDAFFERAFARNVEFRFQNALAMVEAFDATVGLRESNDAERHLGQLGLGLRGTTSRVSANVGRPNPSKWLASHPIGAAMCVGLGFGLGLALATALRRESAPGSASISTDAAPSFVSAPGSASISTDAAPSVVSAPSMDRTPTTATPPAAETTRDFAATSVPLGAREPSGEYTAATVASGARSGMAPSRASGIRPLTVPRGAGRGAPEAQTASSPSSAVRLPANAVDPVFGLPLRETNHVQPK